MLSNPSSSIIRLGYERSGSHRAHGFSRDRFYLRNSRFRPAIIGLHPAAESSTGPHQPWAQDSLSSQVHNLAESAAPLQQQLNAAEAGEQLGAVVQGFNPSAAAAGANSGIQGASAFPSVANAAAQLSNMVSEAAAAGANSGIQGASASPSAATAAAQLSNLVSEAAAVGSTSGIQGASASPSTTNAAAQLSNLVSEAGRVVPSAPLPGFDELAASNANLQAAATAADTSNLTQSGAASSDLNDLMTAMQSSSGHGIGSTLSDIASGSDPADAARKLQELISSYRGEGDPAMDQSIDAAVNRLQSIIEANTAYTDPAAAASAVVTGVEGATSNPAFHNYLVDGVSGTLDQVQNLLTSSMANMAASASTSSAAEHWSNPEVAHTQLAGHSVTLTAAADNLRNLVGQITDAGRLYQPVNTEEQEALNTVVSQLAKIADRIAVADTQRALAEPAAAAAAASATNSATAGVAESATAAAAAVGAGAEMVVDMGSDDAVLDLLDRIYTGVVVNSGLRQLMLSIKDLGDGLANAMDQTWDGAPNLSKVMAYMVALAGVAYLMRSKIPTLHQIQAVIKIPSPAEEKDGESGKPSWPQLSNPFARASSNSPTSSTGSESTTKPSQGVPASASGTSDRTFIPAGAQLLGKDDILDLLRQIGTLDSSTKPPTAAGSAPSHQTPLIMGADKPSTGGAASNTAEGGASKGRKSDLWGLGAGSTPILNDTSSLNKQAAEAPLGDQVVGVVAAMVASQEKENMQSLAGQAPKVGLPITRSSTTSKTTSQSMSSMSQLLGYSRDTSATTAAAEATMAALMAFDSESSPSPPSVSASAAWSATSASIPPTPTARGSSAGVSIPAPPPVAPSPALASHQRSSATPQLSSATSLATELQPLSAASPATSSATESLDIIPVEVEQREVVLASRGEDTLTKRGSKWLKRFGPDVVLAPPTPQTAMANSAVTRSAAAVAAAMAAAAVAQTMGREADRMAKLFLEEKETKLVKDRQTLSHDIKERLSVGACALGPVLAVVPGGESVRDQMDILISQLETIRPPLGAEEKQPQMAGDWKLVYASNGSTPPQPRDAPTHNLFAQMLQVADSIPGFGMEALTQRLIPDSNQPGVLLTENSTTFSFGPLGSWKVRVTGRWHEGGGLHSNFDTFAVRPVSFVGLPSENFPEVATAIPPMLQSHSAMKTTYLDADTRVCRDGNAGVFLFKKG